MSARSKIVRDFSGQEVAIPYDPRDDAQHTPGPWRLSKYGQLVEPQPDRTFRGDYDVQLSVAGGVSTPSGNGHPKRAEAIANRDLIVQAPAMKQALLDLLNWYDMDEGDLRPLMNAARVVIAAAEGK